MEEIWVAFQKLSRAQELVTKAARIMLDTPTEDARQLLKATLAAEASARLECRQLCSPEVV